MIKHKYWYRISAFSRSFLITSAHNRTLAQEHKKKHEETKNGQMDTTRKVKQEKERVNFNHCVKNLFRFLNGSSVGSFLCLKIITLKEEGEIREKKYSKRKVKDITENVVE